MRKILFFSLLFLFFISGVIAYPGVSPSSYEIDFEPGLKKSFLFGFFSPENMDMNLFVEGDLAEYVKLNKDSLKSSGEVIASLELPQVIVIPGVHIIYVRAQQNVKKNEGVSIALNVGGIIKVRVPYPGKYAELDFNVQNVNKGELANFDLTVFSRGEEDIFATAILEIRENQEEELIEKINLGSKNIESKKSEKFSLSLDTSDYLSGDYNATAIVEYGGENPSVSSKIFRIGTLFVSISNYTKEFERNKINRFVIEVESFWNDPISGLYAEVDILNSSESFRTPFVDLEPWKKTTLNGFFDTSNLDKDNFKANITLYYHNTTTSQVVDLSLLKEINYVSYVIISISLIILLFLIWRIIIYIKKHYKFVKK